MKDENGITKLDEFRHKMGELEKAKREADRLRQEAIGELLQRRKEITRQLRQLGYESDTHETERVVSVDSPVASLHAVPLFRDEPLSHQRRKRMVAKNGQERQCPVCEVRGHDLRAHRGQSLKRPFSEQELRERGLVG
ncbi:MAG: hypothetical protein ACRENP_10670 [Longimicrobiales bacterium]